MVYQDGFYLCPDIDGDLLGDLQDDGQSPAPKKAKKTPAKSRLGRSDHLEAKMFNYFLELDKQYRLDAEAERAHIRALVSPFMKMLFPCFATCFMICKSLSCIVLFCAGREATGRQG
jgi:hypothetical protein